MSIIIPMLGKKFGQLKVLSLSHKDTKGRYFYKCFCDCGKQTIVRGSSLRSQNTKSCGCVKRGGRKPTHGMSNNPMYLRWKTMLSRCHNPKSTSYKDYGKRGVVVCKQWHTFENFLKDMGNPPYSGAELNRVDNNKGYSPENCCWATDKTQSRNRRNTRWIKYRGKTMSLAEWTDALGLSYKVIWLRMKRGKSFSQAIKPY